MPVSEVSYEYRAFFDRNFDPLVGIDSYTKKFLVDHMNKKYGKGWEYESIAPLSAIVAEDTQPQGFCFLFKRPVAQVSPKEKQSKRK
jgi:hypothetical protein